RVEPTAEPIVGASPTDLAQAVRELEAAADREQVFALLLRAAASCLPFAALLSVHRDEFRGRRVAASEAFDASAALGLRLARNVVPAFEQAVSTGSVYLGPIATGVAAHDEQLGRLGGIVPAAALVLPVFLAGRAIAIVVGH